MPKVVSYQELGRIAALIAQYPEGIGVEALLDALGRTIPRRTLQRRLAALVKQQRVISVG